MRKIFLIFLLCFSFLDAYIDECKSDVYFANGIDTDEDTARDSIDEIKRLYRAKHSNSDNTVKDWDIVYNHTHGIGLDLYESMLQKIYEDHPGSSLTPFIWNISEISDYFVLSFKGVVSRVAKKIPKDSVKEYASAAAKTLAKKAVLVYNKKYGKKLTQEEIELMFNEIFDFLIEKSVDAYVTMSAEEILEQERADVSEHLKTYRQSVIDGHGVIIVAHSQGNLFVNRAYNELGASANLNHDEWMKSYIHAIGVASPANNILGEGSPYITFDNDVIQLVPDSLEANLTNPTRYYFTNAANEQVETIFSVKAHSFLTSYMATDITRNTILDFIDDKIDEHKKADSQWVIDQELNKGTKDYRVTVKHKLEPIMTPIMDGVEVYPFAPSKKLYYVQGEFSEDISGYVKASCGGTKILDADKDTWDNQEDNEVYYLEGTGEKIILGGLSFMVEYYYDIVISDGFLPRGSPAHKIIASSSSCVFYESGGSGSSILNLQSDDYYLAWLDNVRNDVEYYNFNQYPNGSSTSNQLKCYIEDNGHSLEDYTSVQRESENRYIIEDYRNENTTRYVLEQKYIMVQ